MPGAKPLSMEEALPEVYAQLAGVFDTLETHYRDMQDIEFTVQQGTLWMLQTRSGKRTAKAALKIAVDMAEEGLISRDEAVARVDPAALDAIKRANSADPQKIREALTQTKDFEGSAGGITINAERNADKAAVFKTVKDGKFVFLTTVKP